MIVTAPAGQASGKPAAAHLPQLSIRLSLADPTAAPGAIREALLRSGGTIIAESEPQQHRIRARMPAARLDELLQRLERLGRVSERPAPPAGDREQEVTIQW